MYVYMYVCTIENYLADIGLGKLCVYYKMNNKIKNKNNELLLDNENFKNNFCLMQKRSLYISKL